MAATWTLSQTPATYAVVAARGKDSPAQVFGYTDDLEEAVQASRELRKTANEGETVSPVKVSTYGRKLIRMSKERLHNLGLI